MKNKCILNYIESGETLLDSIAISIYLDDGDGIFEADGSDMPIETQDTNLGQYEFTNLAENQDYWVQVDTSDRDLSGYSYGGGDAVAQEINPRLISLTNSNISDINFPFDATLPGGVGNVNVCYLVGDGNSGS